MILIKSEISDLISLAILFTILAILGVLIVRSRVRQNYRIILFLVGFILFFDELWMFGIPLGRILPDMSDFHIEGFHHWMLGLFLMVLIGMSYIFSTLNQQTGKTLKYQLGDKQKGFSFSPELKIHQQ